METVGSVIRCAGRVVGGSWRLGACAAVAGLAVSGPALGSSVLGVDFESYALGPLGAPWSVSFNTGPDGASTARIVSIAAQSPVHGKVLLLNGKTSPAYLIASLPLSASAPDISVAFDVEPASGASFVWGFHGAGGSIGSRRIRLQRGPGSTMLVAQTVPSGTTNCGALASNAWSKVVLTVHTQLFPHTFDVAINGVPTACKGTPANLSPPFSQVSIMDASNEGWGGKVWFDNISVTTP